jgi:hypothetical protein
MDKSFFSKIYTTMEQLAGSSFIRTLIRLGFIVRGVLYMLIGILGMGVALGLQSSIKDFPLLVQTALTLPQSRIISFLLLVGLIGFGSWGIIRAILDPNDKGYEFKSIIERVGYLVSGLSYLLLSLVPLGFLLNFTSQNTTSQNITDLLFRFTLGTWLVAIVGLIIVIGGVGQIIYGLKEKFKRALKVTNLNKDQEKLIIITGKLGYILRGIIYILLGIFFFKAGLAGNSGEIKSIAEILVLAWHQTGGVFFLGSLSIGFIAFGLHSILTFNLVKLSS